MTHITHLEKREREVSEGRLTVYPEICRNGTRVQPFHLLCAGPVAPDGRERYGSIKLLLKQNHSDLKKKKKSIFPCRLGEQNKTPGP